MLFGLVIVAASASGAPEIVREPWSREAVAKLRGEGRIIYVDFTARWCATCQANKKLVFHNDELLRTFAAKKIATLRATGPTRIRASRPNLPRTTAAPSPSMSSGYPAKMRP